MNWIASGEYARGPPSHLPSQWRGCKQSHAFQPSLRAQWRFIWDTYTGEAIQWDL